MMVKINNNTWVNDASVREVTRLLSGGLIRLDSKDYRLLRKGMEKCDICIDDVYSAGDIDRCTGMRTWTAPMEVLDDKLPPVCRIEFTNGTYVYTTEQYCRGWLNGL